MRFSPSRDSSPSRRRPHVGAVRGARRRAAVREAGNIRRRSGSISSSWRSDAGQPRMAEEGPSSAAESAFLERAFPADTISVAQMERAQRRRRGAGRPFPTGKGRKGTWVTVGPSEALYPFERFRNSFNYVPNAYVAGGRTTSIALAGACKPGDCARTSRRRAAASGARRTRSPASRTGSTSAARSASTRPARSTRSERPERDNRLRRHRRGEHLRLRVRRRNRPLQVDERRRHVDGPLGGSRSTAKGIGAIVVKPGSPNTIYAGVTTALRGMSSVCCSGVTRPVPGARSGACTSRRTAARPGASSTTARPTSPTAWATSPSGTTGGRARRAASARWRSTRRTRRSCTRPRTPAASGARPTAARRGRRSSRR